jgi:hypothetical protein
MEATVTLFLILTLWSLFIRISYAANEFDSLKSVKSHVNLTHLIHRINETIDPIVDASLEQLINVYHAGNLCPFRRNIFTKMQKNEPIKIMILGGSVTVGADLKNPSRQRWSTLFEAIMNSGWYQNKIEVINKAMPACNINSWVNMIHIFNGADLVIVDLSVNDQGFDLQVLPHYYATLIQLLDDLPNHPALLFQQAFRSALKDQKDINGHCPDSYMTCCNGYYACKRWWDMQDFVAITLKKFHIPYVSYRDLVWPQYEQPPNTLPQFWNGMSHPDYRAHQLMAKLLSYGFMMQIKEAHHATYCGQNHTNDNDNNNLNIQHHLHHGQAYHAHLYSDRYVSLSSYDNTTKPLCPQPLSSMLATDQPSSVSSFPLVTPMPPMHSWQFYNDSKQKYGWIFETNQSMIHQICGTNNNNNNNNQVCDHAFELMTIGVKIHVSTITPIIQIRYLKSYTNVMNDIQVHIDHYMNESIIIHGKWDPPYSVQHLLTISRERLTGYNGLIVGENMMIPSLSGGEHTLYFSIPKNAMIGNDGWKWKLIGVVSC